MGIALDFRAVQAVEDLAGVGGQGGEDFGAGAAHGHEADGGFGVGLCFAVEDEVGGVGLGVPAGGDVVAVAAGFAVVDAGVVLVTYSEGLVVEEVAMRTRSSLLPTPSWRYWGRKSGSELT